MRRRGSDSADSGASDAMRDSRLHSGKKALVNHTLSKLAFSEPWSKKAGS